MDDIGFVIRSFLITCFIVFVLQVKVGDQSLERQITSYFEKTAASKWFHDMGNGAARLTASTYKTTVSDNLKKMPSLLGDTKNPVAATTDVLDATKKIENQKFERLNNIENQ